MRRTGRMNRIITSAVPEERSRRRNLRRDGNKADGSLIHHRLADVVTEAHMMLSPTTGIRRIRPIRLIGLLISTRSGERDLRISTLDTRVRDGHQIVATCHDSDAPNTSVRSTSRVAATPSGDHSNLSDDRISRSRTNDRDRPVFGVNDPVVRDFDFKHVVIALWSTVSPSGRRRQHLHDENRHEGRFPLRPRRRRRPDDEIRFDVRRGSWNNRVAAEDESQPVHFHE